jgi:formamidopyrimidine-DNA glycosylase
VPELPEVEVVRAGLAPAVTDAVVERVEVLDERSLRRHGGPAEDFVERLLGARLATPRRRGKFLWIPIAGHAGADSTSAASSAPPPSEAIVVHLGMSGQVLLRTPEHPRDRLTRIVLDVRHPDQPLRIDFVDQRIFGSMAIDALVPTPEALAGGAGAAGDTVPTQVAHIARDPLDPLFDERRLLAALARKGTGIKRALLDQTLVSGIGNIYADESLWAARLHYAQPAGSLSTRKARELLAEVRLVLGRALAEGGTSFDAQYVNVNGASGYFSHSLNAYGRQGEPCPRCGRAIVREQFMNRGSHFCPRCQRLR